MRGKKTLIIGFIIVIIFVIIATYFWYLYFLKANGVSTDGSISYNEKKSDIELVDINNIRLVNEQVREDGSNVEGYTFKVVNNSNEKKMYTLYLEDLPYNEVNDGCTLGTTLTRKELSYQLKMNGKLMRYGDLSEIIDNILDEHSINANDSNSYEFRVWINNNAKDYEKKHYHYKVTLKEGI